MRTTNLSKGSPAKVLILFALPMILSVTLQQIYNIADSSIAGRMIDSNALSAVSVSYPINMIYLSFATGLGVGIGVITSRFFGAGDHVNSKSAISTSLIFAVFLAIVMSLLGVLISKPTLRLIDTPKEILNDADLYLKFYCGGLLFTYLYNVITAIYQSLGNSKIPLYFLIFSTVLNIILDILFVGACDLGILGLALGTLLAQAVAMICSLLCLVRMIKKNLSTEEKFKVFNTRILSQILVIAIPSIIQGSTISIGNFLIQKKINSFDSAMLIAGYGAAYKLCYIVVNIFVAYSNAISNYTAQNIGAGEPKRILSGFKWSILICLIFSVIMSGVILLFREQLLNVFMSSNKVKYDADGHSAMYYGKIFCYIVAPFFFLMGIKIPSDGVLKGAKDMASLMTGTFLDLILRVALSYILGSLYGYKALFLAWPIGWSAGMLVSASMFFVGRWKKKAGWQNI